MSTLPATERRTLRRRFLVWLGAIVTDSADVEHRHSDGSAGSWQPDTAGWHWVFADEAGVAVAGPPLSFGSQQVAEEWLTENFDDLFDAGITAVSLQDRERTVYGPMSLSPEEPGATAGAS
jgi:hypothetical protein